MKQHATAPKTQSAAPRKGRRRIDGGKRGKCWFVPPGRTRLRVQAYA
jgi:hypothetical protein